VFYLRTIREMRESQQAVMGRLWLILKRQRTIMQTEAEVIAELKGIKTTLDGFIPTVVALVQAAQNQQNASQELSDAAAACQTSVDNLKTALTPASPPPAPTP